MGGKPRKCGDCPKWVRCWCCIYAKWVSAGATACDYGRKLMYNAYMAAYMRDYKRRNAHETDSKKAVVDRQDGLRLDTDAGRKLGQGGEEREVPDRHGRRLPRPADAARPGRNARHRGSGGGCG